MVKAGPAVDAVVDQLSPFLEEGDLLIDGGNSDYQDTERRVKQLESKSFGFIGMGVSGGAKGALEGPSMMPGGTKASYDAIESLVTKMAAQVEDGPCVTYIGPGGSGHLVKTVHNGIEYGIEQILAEAYDLMKRVKGMNGDQMADVLGQWNSTEELASYLVEITEVCLRTKDPKDGADLVEKIMDQAGQKGTGLWTVVTALQMGASVPTIYASLNGRVMSSMKPQRVHAEQVLKGPSIKDFDLGKPEDGMSPLMDAVVLSCVASYAQGMELLRIASNDLDYALDMPSIAQIWKGGCIIRSRLLKRIQDAFSAKPELENLMVDPWFAEQVNRRLPGLAQVVAGAAEAVFPCPVSAALLTTSTATAQAVCPKTLFKPCAIALAPTLIRGWMKREASTPSGWIERFIDDELPRYSS